MRRMRRRVKLAVRRCRELKREPRLSFAERTEGRYAEAGAEVLAYHEALPPFPARGGGGGGARSAAWHNFALQLRNCRKSVPRFLHEPVDPECAEARMQPPQGLLQWSEVLFAALAPNGRLPPPRPASPRGPPLTHSLQPTSGRSAGLLGQLLFATLSFR